MGVFLIKIAYSVSSSEKLSDSYQYLRNVGDKLRNYDQYEKAIVQHIKYLQKTKIKNPSRAMVAHRVCEQYMYLSNC